jgi:hypothetical protein
VATPVDGRGLEAREEGNRVCASDMGGGKGGGELSFCASDIWEEAREEAREKGGGESNMHSVRIGLLCVFLEWDLEAIACTRTA